MSLKMYEANKIIGTLPTELRNLVMSNRDNELSMYTNNFELDIVSLDEDLGKHDPEYDHLEGLYKGKKVSVGEYIEAKYGKDIYDIVHKLI